MHPFLPVPTDIADTPKYINIESLESADGPKAEIWSSMKNRGSDSRVVYTNWTISRGDSLTEGVQVSVVRATYRWKPVTIHDSKLYSYS